MKVTTGYSKNGLPYACVEGGKRVLFIMDGLDFSHTPPSPFQVKYFSGYVKTLVGKFTIYMVRRKPGLPAGYSLKDMSDDYAVMIEELDWPVDVMGLSTGGTVAQHFAADHLELVDRLVLASTGYRLRDEARHLQWQLGQLARNGEYRAAAALMSGAVFTGVSAKIFKPVFWLIGKSMFGSSSGPSDGIIEIEAEDKHDFRERLAEIKAPTLVIGGDLDFFYPIRETAEGIPGARLVLYENAGHAAIMKSCFGKDVLAFLEENTKEKPVE